MTMNTTRDGLRDYATCDHCGKRARRRADGLDWIGGPGWTAAPYPERVWHTCPDCQRANRPLLPEVAEWWRNLRREDAAAPDDMRSVRR